MKSMLCVVLLSLSLAALATDDFTYPDPNRWANDIKAFDGWDSKNAAPANPILFVGSSTNRLWKTADAFPGLPVINRGFGGSWMADSVHFVDRLVIRYKPQIVVVYAGDNDIAGGLSPQLVHSDFVKLANAIHKALPQTHIICLSVKPSQSRIKFMPQVLQANRLNSDFAKITDYITYFDGVAALLDAAGQPDPAYFEPDALHLNQKGYDKWAALLAPILKQKSKP